MHLGCGGPQAKAAKPRLSPLEVVEAPEPSNLIWENLGAPWAAVQTARMITIAMVVTEEPFAEPATQ